MGGQPAAAPAPAATSPQVKIVEPAFQPTQAWTYEPNAISTRVGQAVTWTNGGAVAHTVTADDGRSFDSGTMAPVATFTFTPSTTGTFAYHCTFHPWMKGTLTTSS